MHARVVRDDFFHNKSSASTETSPRCCKTTATSDGITGRLDPTPLTEPAPFSYLSYILPRSTQLWRPPPVLPQKTTSRKLLTPPSQRSGLRAVPYCSVEATP
ncbi:hypothetical protein MRX96_017924 [Rhipicephalus microplus]